MANKQIIVTGEKETFLVRVLMKKLEDAMMQPKFIHWSIDAINENWDNTSLITMYMDDGERPRDDTLHFLIDKMVDDDKHVILIGSKDDVEYVQNQMPKRYIYKTFIRPMDNDVFVNVVRELQSKVAIGEFRKSVLVVDDDPNYLNLVREWLKGTYKVALVNSGLQALKWLGKNKADLILLDHEMPVISGPQVLEMLRSEDETKSIPVMFLTGKSDKESVMEVLALKPEGYFLKTIEREELLSQLKDYFTWHK